MKKTFICSVCGCFVTSAAVALSFYVDLGGENSLCPVGWGICAMKPENGTCCPAGSVIQKINVSADSDAKVLDGLYIGETSSGVGGAKLFNYDGTAVNTKDFTPEQQEIIRGAAAAGGDSAKVTKKQQDQGTIYIDPSDLENGGYTETLNPAKGGMTCERVHMILKTCTEYRYLSNGGTECKTPYTVADIYYKKGAGYFTSPSYSPSTRLRDADTPSSGGLVPTPSVIPSGGYIFRGYFTSVWTDNVGGSSTKTETSSYINNLSPYRTIGHAYIPWRYDLVDGNTSGNELFLRAPNWVVSGSDVTSCPSEGYTMNLYAGWARGCTDSEHCTMTISGKNTTTKTMYPESGGTSITGNWLPGGVQYDRLGNCKNEETGSTYVTKKYPYGGSNSLTFKLGTYALSCSDNGNGNEGTITVNYYQNDVKVGYTYCNVGETVRLNGPSSWTTVTALKYKGDTTSGITFIKGTEYPCNVGTGGFTNYITNGNNYIVNLEPVTTVNDPGSSGGGSEGSNDVIVTLILNGGKMSGNEGEKTVNVVVEKGGTLSEYQPSDRVDGAVFVGWTKEGAAVETANKDAVISSNSGNAVTYNAQYTCPQGKGNINGTCFNVEKGDDGEVHVVDEIIDRGGNPVNPNQGSSCWRYEPNENGVYHWENYCYWNIDIKFHGKPSGATLPTNVNDPNEGEGKYMACTGTPCSAKGGLECQSYYENGSCRRMRVPTASGYTFRGYYRQPLPTDVITDHSTTEGAAFSKFYPVDLGTHATIIMNDTPVTNYTYPGNPVHVYAAWAKDCNPGENATCNRTISTNWYVGNGMNKGDVRYDTGCANGYVINQGTGGTATPTCTTEKGNNVTINYTFKDQFGRTVPSSGATSSCVAAENFSLPNSSFVQSTLGSNYSPKYFAMTDVNGSANWYTAGRSLMCGTNTFGPMTQTTGGGYSASVVGTVCYNFCTVGQRYGQHGNCVAMTGTGPTAQQLGISYPTYYAINGGYYIVNGSYNVANLWEGCPTVQCDSATSPNGDGTDYGMYVDPDGTSVSCVDKSTLGGGSGGNTSHAGGGDTFTCPNYSISGVNVTKERISGTTDGCRYTLSCSGNHIELEGATNTTATCYGNNGAQGCTTAYLNSQFGNAQCVFQCPLRQMSGFGGENYYARYDSVSGNTCKYKVMCHANCSDDDCRLTYNNAIVTNHKGDAVYVTCTGDDCYSSLQPNSSNINPNLHFDRFDCKSVASMSSTYQCPWASWFTTGHLASGVDSERTYITDTDTFDLLNSNGITMTIDTNTPVNGQCTYTLGCSTSGQTSTPATFTCSGKGTGDPRDNSCNVANMRARLTATYPSCGAAPQYTCPTTGLPTIDHGSISNPSACNYKATCNSSNYTCNTSTGLCIQKACHDSSSCTELFAQYTSHASDLCQATTPSTITCPTGDDIPTIAHGKINYSGAKASSCSYTATCTEEGYTCDTSTGLCDTQTCTSESGCNTLMSQYQNSASIICKSDTLQCPSASSFNTGNNKWDEHGTVEEPIKTNDTTCKYELTCDNNYNINSSPAYVTCSGTECTEAGVRAKLQQKSCVYSGITCPDVSLFNGWDPNGKPLELADHGLDYCQYRVSCNTGYGLNQTSSTITCLGESNCTQQKINEQLAPYACDIQCPAVSGLTKPSNSTLTAKTASNNTSCKYELKCDTDYDFTGGTASSPAQIQCSGTTGSDGCTTSSLNAVLGGYHCKHVLSEDDCTAAFQEGTGAAGQVTGVLSENNTKCTFTANCDVLGTCTPGSGLDNTYCSNTKVCTYDGSTSSNIPKCSDVKTNYSHVSCKVDGCPSVDKLNQYVTPVIKQTQPNFSGFTASNYAGQYECKYAANCASGYTSCTGDNCCTGSGLGSCYPSCNKSTNPKCMRNGASGSGNATWYSQVRCVSSGGGSGGSGSGTQSEL